MKYYLHDSTAFSDEKVTLLYLKFGFEAVGLFYVILEKLALQEQPVNEMVLKSQLSIKKRLQKQLDFMYEIGILSVNNGDVFNKNLLNFSEKYQIKKEKTRKRVSDWRKNQDDKENVTRYKHVRNTDKDKISKVKEKKEYSDEIKNFTASLSKYFSKSIIDKLSESQKLSWIDTVDKLIRIDNYKKEEITMAVKNATSDSFWFKNFYSLNKLRKKNEKQDCNHMVIFLNLDKQNGKENKIKYTPLPNQIK